MRSLKLCLDLCEPPEHTAAVSAKLSALCCNTVDLMVALEDESEDLQSQIQLTVNVNKIKIKKASNKVESQTNIRPAEETSDTRLNVKLFHSKFTSSCLSQKVNRKQKVEQRAGNNLEH